MISTRPLKQTCFKIGLLADYLCLCVCLCVLGTLKEDCLKFQIVSTPSWFIWGFLSQSPHVFFSPCLSESHHLNGSTTQVTVPPRLNRSTWPEAASIRRLRSHLAHFLLIQGTSEAQPKTLYQNRLLMLGNLRLHSGWRNGLGVRKFYMNFLFCQRGNYFLIAPDAVLDTFL